MISAEWVQWGAGAGVVVAVSLFLRLNARDKLCRWLQPKFMLAGQFVSRFLVLRLGARGAERFEEGIIVTLISVLTEALASFQIGLLCDNELKKKEAQDK